MQPSRLDGDFVMNCTSKTPKYHRIPATRNHEMCFLDAITAMICCPQARTTIFQVCLRLASGPRISTKTFGHGNSVVVLGPWRVLDDKFWVLGLEQKSLVLASWLVNLIFQGTSEPQKPWHAIACFIALIALSLFIAWTCATVELLILSFCVLSHP